MTTLETAPGDLADLPASADTVRNPDWIAARLSAALDSPDPVFEVEFLRAWVSLYSDSADTATAAITTRDLPSPIWARSISLRHDEHRRVWVPRLVGQVGSEYADRGLVGELWAQTLGLTEQHSDDVTAGSREWVGTVDGWAIRIWAVVDMDAFDAAIDAILHPHT